MAKKKKQDSPESTGEKPGKGTGKGNAPGSQAHWFQPGNNANPLGRPKGIKNAIQRDFLLAVQEKFNAHGDKAMNEMIAKAPARFLEMVARLLPQEHSWDDDQAEGFFGVLKALGQASKSKEE